MSGLFRRAALDKISNPEQLDHALRVVRPQHVPAIATVILIVLGGLVWSIFSTAPVTVQGHGILLSAGGVAVVSSPSDGRIERILVRPDEAVVAGQMVGLLRKASSLDSIHAKQAELSGARDLLEARRSAYERYRAMEGEFLDTKRQALTEQIRKLQAQHEAQVERRDDLQDLFARGFATSNKLEELEIRVAELESRMATLRNDRVELIVRQQREEQQRVQEIREADLRVQALAYELENMRREYDRSRRLTAPVDGTVVDLNLNRGDQVATGQIVMRLLPTEALDPRTGTDDDLALRAIVFVPNDDGKRIRPGMEAHIMPSTVKLQKYGFIRGTVLNVARIPSSRDGMMRRLKNATQVDTLLKTGAPFEVELELLPDPSSPSGFRWSSGVGPAISIDAGTITAADVVIERQRVISLALPAFDYIFRWLGVE